MDMDPTNKLQLTNIMVKKMNAQAKDLLPMNMDVIILIQKVDNTNWIGPIGKHIS